MRIVELAAAAALAAGLATAAHAAPAAVDVTIGPKLQAQAEKTYGVREVSDLAADLKKAVTRELGRTGAYDGARIELTLVDARPTRPTFKQLGDKPGLSYQSVSLGGAEIVGRIVAADGQETPIRFRDYETDLRFAADRTTWGDADLSVDRFARNLAHGRKMASR